MVFFSSIENSLVMHHLLNDQICTMVISCHKLDDQVYGIERVVIYRQSLIDILHPPLSCYFKSSVCFILVCILMIARCRHGLVVIITPRRAPPSYRQISPHPRPDTNKLNVIAFNDSPHNTLNSGQKIANLLRFSSRRLRSCILQASLLLPL